jgi:tRNA(His) guanylyltransferase
MQESYWDRSPNQPKHELFSQLQVPSDTPFFARLDGRRFQAISEKVGADKPFDEKFAKCLIASARASFESNFNPALVYVASDEMNVLFLHTSPFRRRIEKTNSILAGIASSAFSLSVAKLFKKTLITAFDSRITIFSQEKVTDYLTWRQVDAWRNHNNAYAYWLFRRNGYKPSEATKKLKGLKTKDLHKILFSHGINLTQTPAWQRRGILLYRELYQKRVKNHIVIRRQIKENWNLPLFSSKEGKDLIRQILRWTKPPRRKRIGCLNLSSKELES